MATRERPADRGRRVARDDLHRIGSEFRAARIGAGLALRIVAAEVGLSASQILRIERGMAKKVLVEQLAAIGAVVGLDVRIRSYAGPDALRDAGQGRLLGRLRARLHSSLRFLTEVTLPIIGDQRAWDGWIDGLVGPRRSIPVEAETRLSDWQALQRRLQRKLRDSEEPFVLLIVSDTRSNRDAVAAIREQIDASFPVPPRVALARLAAGQHPGGSALLIL